MPIGKTDSCNDPWFGVDNTAFTPAAPNDLLRLKLLLLVHTSNDVLIDEGWPTEKDDVAVEIREYDLEYILVLVSRSSKSFNTLSYD